MDFIFRLSFFLIKLFTIKRKKKINKFALHNYGPEATVFMVQSSLLLIGFEVKDKLFLSKNCLRSKS